MNLYRELLMDHYRHPKNKGRLHNPVVSSGQFNPSCGDSITIDLHILDGSISDIAFEGKGCVISQATASLLTEWVKGKALDEILLLDSAAVLGMIGMQLGPTRLKCALLPLEALQEGVKKYQQ